jgi:hypothetical protein
MTEKTIKIEYNWNEVLNSLGDVESYSKYIDFLKKFIKLVV